MEANKKNRICRLVDSEWRVDEADNLFAILLLEQVQLRLLKKCGKTWRKSLAYASLLQHDNFERGRMTANRLLVASTRNKNIVSNKI